MDHFDLNKIVQLIGTSFISNILDGELGFDMIDIGQVCARDDHIIYIE